MNPITFYIYVFAVSASTAHAAFYFPAMPFNMAVHFGPGGQPDLWSAREAYFGLVFAMIALNVAVFGFAPWFASVLRFRKFGIPNKAYWMASERLDAFYIYFKGKMAWFGAANVCFLAFVNQLVFDANITSEPLSDELFIVGLAVYFVFVIIWLLTFLRKLSAKS